MATLPEEMLARPALLPMKTLLTAVTREQPAFTPIATLPWPVVLEHKALQPRAALPVPEERERKALQPRAALDALVQPTMTPATVGVAAAELQQIALLPLLLKN
jgi:hypothetical protein